MISETQNTNIPSYWDWLDSSIDALAKLLGIRDTSEDTSIEINPNNKPSIEEEQDLGISFTVHPEMQMDLRFLGIEKDSGEQLHWKPVRQAYHKSALRAHPDKGGSEEAFRQVHTSYKAVEALIFPQINDSRLTAQTTDAAVARMDAEITKREEEAIKLNTKVTEVMSEVNRAASAVKELIQKFELQETLLKAQQKASLTVSPIQHLSISQNDLQQKISYLSLFYPLSTNKNLLKEKTDENSQNVIIYSKELYSNNRK